MNVKLKPYQIKFMAKMKELQTTNLTCDLVASGIVVNGCGVPVYNEDLYKKNIKWLKDKNNNSKRKVFEKGVNNDNNTISNGNQTCSWRYWTL